MSFLDDVFDFGKSAYDWFKGDSTTAGLARTALTGYALNQVTSSINKDNDSKNPAAAKADPGVRIQVDPDTEYKVPIVYGTAILGGAITDAYLTDDSKTMYFVITICERTGNLNLGSGAASAFTLEGVWWDSFKVNLSGTTVTGFTDTEGNVDTNPNGLINIWFYAGSSTEGAVPAWSVMPGWTSAHTMNDLVFAIVKVEYNKEKNVTKLGNLDFKIRNTMTEPGDCIYDYMTNTRYGAGIDPQEINSQ
jgi:hypothetical protein